jgi:hypothetical protein
LRFDLAGLESNIKQIKGKPIKMLRKLNDRQKTRN